MTGMMNSPKQQQQQQQHGEGRSSSGPHWIASSTGEDTNIKDDSQEPGLLHLSPKALTIIWGNDTRFWRWIPLTQDDKSHFGVGAELLQVNWIEISGKLEFSCRKLCTLVTYEIYYVVRFKEDAFGWHSIPIKFKVKQSSGLSQKEESTEISEVLETYRTRHGVWHNIYGGQFTVPEHRDGAVEFGMYEVDSDWWKGSIVLLGVKLVPKVTEDLS